MNSDDRFWDGDISKGGASFPTQSPFSPSCHRLAEYAIGRVFGNHSIAQTDSDVMFIDLALWYTGSTHIDKPKFVGTSVRR